MTRSKIAITLPRDNSPESIAKIRAGRADSVSGYIAGILAEHEKRESLRVLLGDLIEQYGKPSEKQIKWAKRAPRLATPGLTLDTSALIALDRDNKRRSSYSRDFCAAKKPN